MMIVIDVVDVFLSVFVNINIFIKWLFVGFDVG